jgi:hypothetical protein
LGGIAAGDHVLASDTLAFDVDVQPRPLLGIPQQFSRAIAAAAVNAVDDKNFERNGFTLCRGGICLGP